MRLDRAIAEAIRKWTGVKTATTGRVPDRPAASGRSRGSTAVAYPAAVTVDPDERPELRDEPPRLESSAPPSTSLLSFTGKDREIEGVVVRNAERLERAGVDVEGMHQLGSGAQGVAYGLHDGRVLKVTTDASEAHASAAVMGRNLRHVVKVDDVFRFPDDERAGGQFYGIVQERLLRLSAREMADLDELLPVRTLAPMDAYTSWDRLSDFVMRRFGGEETLGRAQVMLSIMRRYGIDRMVDELASAGVRFRDYHKGNVMRRGSGYVVTDLGISEAPTGRVRTLEGVILRVLDESIADRVGLLVLDGGPIDRHVAGVVRGLVRRFDKLAVVMASDGPFTYGLGRDMLKASLPDVEGHLESYRMTGDLPEVISHIVRDEASSIDLGTPVTILVGRGLGDATRRGLEAGHAEWYDPGLYAVEEVPLPSDDGRLIPAVVADDVPTVRSEVDPHVLSDEGRFDNLYARMRAEVGRTARVESLVVEFLADVGGAKAVDDVLARNGTRLATLKGIKVGGLRKLGTGSNGTAFRMPDGRVLKVTSDEKEARVAASLVGRSFRHIYRVYDVWTFPQRYRGHGLWGIVQEEDLEKPTTQERAHFDWLIGQLKSQATWHDIGDARLGTILRRVMDEPKFPPEHKRDILTMVRYFGLNDVMAELRAAGIKFWDYKSGNIMRRPNGDFVLIDLGTFGTPSHGMPPTLEGLVEDRGSLAYAGGERAMRDVLQMNSRSLFDDKGIDVGTLRVLGNPGQMGVAYDVGGGRVLKVTTDEHEARTSWYLVHRGRTLANVARFDDVWRFGRTGDVPGKVFGIVQERLEPLSPQEAKEFDDYVAYIAPDAREGRPGYDEDRKTLDVVSTGTWDQIVARLRDVTTADVKLELLAGRKEPDRKILDRVDKIASARLTTRLNVLKKYGIDKIVRQLRSLGVRFADFHSGNLMKRGSEYVITDLGLSRSPATDEPPIFEIGGAFVGGGLGSTAVLGPRAQSGQWSAGGHYNDDGETEDDRRRRSDDRFSHEEPRQVASSLDVDDLIAMELHRLDGGS